MATTYESCAQTATRVRQALKTHFPGVKFSVRSSTYSTQHVQRLAYALLAAGVITVMATAATLILRGA